MKSEFEFLNDLRQKFDLKKIGDDCAVLPKDSKTDLVITTDLLIEDVDFRFDWTVPELLGHKALAVSLSDVAAMGAKPIWAMLSIGIPQEIWRTDFVEKFYEGWFALAEKFGVELVGGDISKSPDKIVIDSIVAGETGKGKAVWRSTAQPADLIFVSGEIGGAAFGLKLLEEGKRFKISDKQTAVKNLILRQLKPRPRVELGQVLSEFNFASSMIDLSDGLSSDLMHICEESGVGAKIYADKIPSDENLREILSENLDILNFSLNGGEDFELLFTSKPSNLEKILKKNFGTESGKISCIGEITETPEKIELISENETRNLTPEGFRHF